MTKTVLIYFILRTTQKKDVIGMDRKQIHELVNHSLNELQMGGDEAGTADPSAWLQSAHFPTCIAGFLTVLCLIILFSSLHFTEGSYKMCFIAPHAPHSQSFRALRGFVILDRRHPRCVFHENEGRADVFLPGGTLLWNYSMRAPQLITPFASGRSSCQVSTLPMSSEY